MTSIDPLSIRTLDNSPTSLQALWESAKGKRQKSMIIKSNDVNTMQSTKNKEEEIPSKPRYRTATTTSLAIISSRSVKLRRWLNSPFSTTEVEDIVLVESPSPPFSWILCRSIMIRPCPSFTIIFEITRWALPPRIAPTAAPLAGLIANILREGKVAEWQFRSYHSHNKIYRVVGIKARFGRISLGWFSPKDS